MCLPPIALTAHAHSALYCSVHNLMDHLSGRYRAGVYSSVANSELVIDPQRPCTCLTSPRPTCFFPRPNWTQTGRANTYHTPYRSYTPRLLAPTTITTTKRSEPAKLWSNHACLLDRAPSSRSLAFSPRPRAHRSDLASYFSLISPSLPLCRRRRLSLRHAPTRTLKTSLLHAPFLLRGRRSTRSNSRSCLLLAGLVGQVLYFVVG